MTIINQYPQDNGEQTYDIVCPECKGEKVATSICLCGGTDPDCTLCHGVGEVIEECTECDGEGSIYGLTESEVSEYE